MRWYLVLRRQLMTRLLVTGCLPEVALAEVKEPTKDLPLDSKDAVTRLTKPGRSCQTWFWSEGKEPSARLRLTEWSSAPNALVLPSEGTRRLRSDMEYGRMPPEVASLNGSVRPHENRPGLTGCEEQRGYEYSRIAISLSWAG